jgi:vesicle coat complex subunit
MCVHPSTSVDSMSIIRYPTALLCFCLPLLVIGSTWAQTPNSSQVNLYIQQLQSANQQQRISAIESLVGLGKPVVPALVRALKDKNPSVRSSAAIALGKMGVQATSAVPSLSHALQDENLEVRRSAAIAMGKLGRPALVPYLVVKLQSPDASVRYSATHALSRFGADAKPAIPQLTKAIQDNNHAVRFGAVNAVGNLGTIAIPTIPSLVKALQENDESVPPSAAYSLGRIAFSVHENANKVLTQDLDSVIANLETAIKIISNSSVKFPEAATNSIQQQLAALKKIRQQR